MTGTVQHIHRDDHESRQNYFFIRPDGVQPSRQPSRDHDVYAHVFEIGDRVFEALAVGDRVSYELDFDRRGRRRAVSIEVIYEAATR
jgi:cold shock CspA family protein